MADLLSYYPAYRNLLKDESNNFDVNYGAIIKAFDDACNTDLNMPQALANINVLLNKYSEKLDFENAGAILNVLTKMDAILGLKLLPKVHELIPANLISLLESRETKRAENNWTESDVLRGEIENLGFLVKDSPRGQALERKNSSF